MATLTIQTHACPLTSCALCGKSIIQASGPHLYLGESAETVCRDCGKRQAPELVALLDLAGVAARVGRIGRHTLVPPMAALLDLARAAEQFAECQTRPARQAA
jgi:hypothetical protein